MLQSLEEQLGHLRAEFDKATAEKLSCEREANRTAHTIALANRLVGGLSSEKIRWSEAVSQ